MLADIEWDNSRTDEAEAALADLGRHLGLVAQEPERYFGIGSDVLWALGSHSYAVIEAKTGATAPLIWKKDINQLGGSVNWCKSEYGEDANVTPVIVHPSNVIERTGTPPPGARVLTEGKLKALKGALRQFSVAIAQDDAFKSAGSIDGLLQHHSLTSASLFDAYTVLGIREPKKVI